MECVFHVFTLHFIPNNEISWISDLATLMLMSAKRYIPLTCTWRTPGRQVQSTPFQSLITIWWPEPLTAFWWRVFLHWSSCNVPYVIVPCFLSVHYVPHNLQTELWTRQSFWWHIVKMESKWDLRSTDILSTSRYRMPHIWLINCGNLPSVF